MSVTLKDVSLRTGISKSVISMYLNKDTRVRVGKEKKKIIDKVVKEMNYRPSRMACSLRKQQSNMLGLVVGGITDPFFSRLVEALLKYVEDLGYQLLISLTSWDEHKEMKCLETLLERQVDGVIYAPRFPDEEKFQEKIRRNGTPVILMNRKIDRFPAVCQNPEKSFNDMCHTLYDAGCRELFCPQHPHEDTIELLSKLCKSHGIKPRPLACETPDEAVKMILKRTPEYIFIANCWTIKALLKKIKEQQLDYHPKFVTYYNFPVDLIEDEGLAGVIFGHPYSYMKAVVDYLIDLIENKKSGNPQESGIRLWDVSFFTRQEFFQCKNSLEDTFSSSNNIS